MAADLNAHPQAFGSGKLVGWCFEAAPGASQPPAAEGLATLDFEPGVVWESARRAVLSFGDVARFLVDFDTCRVTLISAHGCADASTIDHFLNDHVAPRIIEHLGALVIHGSAITIAGRLAIVMGRTGAGKSTLAASLLQRGHQVLSDDAVIIGKSADTWVGEAVYASLRLFPESIERVFSDKVDTSAMAFYSDKRLVRTEAMATHDPRAVPLGLIFVLTDGADGVKVDPFGPADACMIMLENSFAFDPKSPKAAANRMAMAAALAAAVPCYELSYPYDFGVLDTVCTRVAELMQGLGQPSREPTPNRNSQA